MKTGSAADAPDLGAVKKLSAPQGDDRSGENEIHAMDPSEFGHRA